MTCFCFFVFFEKAESQMYAVGIDLGLTNSCVAVYKNGGVEVISNHFGYRTTPSFVLITDEEIAVGKRAKETSVKNHQNLVYDAKRMIGKKYSDKYLQADISFLQWPFKIENDGFDRPVIHVPNLTRRKSRYTPEEISSFVLSELKKIVEELCLGHGRKVMDVVIAVPAYFNDSQRKATEAAANLAGLKVLKLVNESTAAVLAFRYKYLQQKESKNILVFDLGAEIFDMSIMKIVNGQIQVKVINDKRLGLNNFKEKLVEYLVNKFQETNDEDVRHNRKALWKLRNKAEQAIEDLSSNNRYEIFVDSLQNGEDFEYDLKRNEFESVCKDLFDRTMKIIDLALKNARFNASDIDEVLLVSGSRISKIRELLAAKFGNQKINCTIHSDEAKAYGAAIQAAIITGEIKGIVGEIETIKSNKDEQLHSSDQNYYTIPDKFVTNDFRINAIGIDLGTSRCCAGVNRKNGMETIALDNSNRLLPSYVSFDEEKEKCGRIVIDRIRNYSNSTVFDSKRIIGRSFDEIVIDQFWPFRVIKKDDKVFIETQGPSEIKLIMAEEVSAALLKHIKESGEQHQGKAFNQVLITVPAAFTKFQREATLRASKLAGWDSVELLPEPVAAAFAYFAEREIPNNSTLFLFDLGGGTLDVCIFKIRNNQIQIISNLGDTKLGGRDFDTILINYCKNMLETKFGITISKDKKFKLLQQIEKLKENLTFLKSTSLDVEEIDPSKEGTIEICRENFERMAKELLEKIKNTIFSALYNSGLNGKQINKVLQVGGGSRMPMIKTLLKDIFPNAELCCEQNPDEVVAIGAAYYAYYLKTKS